MHAFNWILCLCTSKFYLAKPIIVLKLSWMDYFNGWKENNNCNCILQSEHACNRIEYWLNSIASHKSKLMQLVSILNNIKRWEYMYAHRFSLFLPNFVFLCSNYAIKVWMIQHLIELNSFRCGNKTVSKQTNKM